MISFIWNVSHKKWLVTTVVRNFHLIYFFFRFLYFIFFLPFIFISWRLITLQYCSGFCHTLTLISHGVTCIPHPDPPSHLPLYPDPSGSSQCTRPEHLSHANNLGWWSVSPLIIYMFWCCSSPIWPRNPTSEHTHRGLHLIILKKNCWLSIET